MSSELWEPVLRTTLVFLVVFTVTRILGQKQISQLTFFDYVVGTAIGSLAASAMSNPTIPLITDVLCFITWGALVLLFHATRLASMPLKKLLEGQPRLVIRDGKILEETLRGGYYSIDDLLAQLREQGVFNPQEVAVGIIETNGQLSILKNSQVQAMPAGKEQIPYAGQDEGRFGTNELIVNGEIKRENLLAAGVTESWLKQQLSARGIEDINTVTLAMLTPKGDLYIDKTADKQ